MASSHCNILERREKASEEGNSSPCIPPEIQEGSSSLHLQNSRRKASLPSRRGGVYKSGTSANVEGSLQQHYFNYELWGEPMPYTAIVNFTKLQLDVVTMKSDLHHLKVGCISNISILKVICSFDLSSLLELQMHSDSRSPAALSRKKQPATGTREGGTKK